MIRARSRLSPAQNLPPLGANALLDRTRGSVQPAEIDPRLFERERLSAQILGALHLDQHAVALLLRIAAFLRLDQAFPDFVVDRAGLVDARRAVETRNAARRQQAELAQLGLAQKHRDLAAVLEVLGGRGGAALP